MVITYKPHTTYYMDSRFARDEETVRETSFVGSIIDILLSWGTLWISPSPKKLWPISEMRVVLQIDLSMSSILFSIDISQTFYHYQVNMVMACHKNRELVAQCIIVCAWFQFVNIVPANMRHRANVVLILGQRQRRWPSVKTTLAQCLMLAEVLPLHYNFNANHISSQ